MIRTVPLAGLGRRFAMIAALAILIASPATARAGFTVFEAAGPDAAAITTFR